MKADRDKTEAKNFFDRRSYVTPDNREVLYGLDWKQRVGELRERSGGRCEWMVAVIRGGLGDMTLTGGHERCRSEAADPDHIMPRRKARDDRLSNLQALCRLHHELKHPEKQPRWRKS